MSLKYLVLFSLTATGLLSETREELEQKGNKELEKGIEEIGIGVGLAGLAVVSGIRGDPVGVATSTVAAAAQVKSGIEHLSEAKKYLEKARESERDNDRDSGTYRESEPASARDN